MVSQTHSGPSKFSKFNFQTLKIKFVFNILEKYRHLRGWSSYSYVFFLDITETYLVDNILKTTEQYYK